MKVFAQEPTPECIEVIGPFKDLCERLRENGEDSGPNILIEIANVISRIVGFITIIAGLFFFFQLLYAGFAWLTSGGDSERLAHARDRITNSLLGLTLVVGALVIMGLVQTFFGIDFLLRDPRKLAGELIGPTPTP